MDLVAPSNAKPNPLDFSCPNDNYIWIRRQLPANSAFVLLQNKGRRMNLGCASGFQNDEFMFSSITGSGQQQWSHSTHFRAEQKEVCSLYHHAQHCQRDEYLSPTTSSIIFLFSFKRNLSLGCTHPIQRKRNSCLLINAQKVRKLVWTKGRDSKEKASNTIYYGFISETISWNVFLACTGWVGLSCIYPAEFWYQLPDGKKKKSPHTFCHLGKTFWFRIHPPPVGVQHPLSTRNCQKFRKHKKIKGEEVCAKHLPDEATACTSPYAREQNHHTQG